jgi:hypothetical protein
MRVDAYTKAVLTVIAACLVWICLNGVTPVMQAQAARPDPTHVILVDAKGNPIYTSEGLRVNLNVRTLPVEVTNPDLPVSVRSLQRTGAWDAIPVQVLREPPTLRPIP